MGCWRSRSSWPPCSCRVRRATNLGNVVTQSAALGCVAIGQTFVIAAGLIDLSVGQLLGLVVVLTARSPTQG
jgi:ribose/xylose/arabinose/galactoside ABC-type transport system permease subunit